MEVPKRRLAAISLGVAIFAVIVNCTTGQPFEGADEFLADIECFSCSHHPQLSPSLDCLDRIGISDVNLCMSGPYCMQYETTNNSELVIAGIGCGNANLCNGTIENSYHILTNADGSMMNYTCCSSDYCNCPQCDLPTVPPPLESNFTDFPHNQFGFGCYFCAHTPEEPSQKCLDQNLDFMDTILCDDITCMKYTSNDGSNFETFSLTCGNEFFCNGTAEGQYYTASLGEGVVMNYTCCTSEYCNCPECEPPTTTPPPSADTTDSNAGGTTTSTTSGNVLGGITGGSTTSTTGNSQRPTTTTTNAGNKIGFSFVGILSFALLLGGF